jgi:hypothetical protein
VVPIVVRGTRRALPNGSLMLRPGRIELEILGVLDTARAALESGGGSERVVARVRDAARGAILGRLGEPDLAAPPLAATGSS